MIADEEGPPCDTVTAGDPNDKKREDKKAGSLVRMIGSMIMYILVFLTWAEIDSDEDGAVLLRNITAKSVYLGSICLLAFELMKNSKTSSMKDAMTNCACILIKPILIVNGDKS